MGDFPHGVSGMGCQVKVLLRGVCLTLKLIKEALCTKNIHVARLLFWTIGNQTGRKPEGKSDWILVLGLENHGPI